LKRWSFFRFESLALEFAWDLGFDFWDFRRQVVGFPPLGGVIWDLRFSAIRRIYLDKPLQNRLKGGKSGRITRGTQNDSATLSEK